MPYTDHIDHHLDDEDDEDGITCNRCGEDGLYWQKVTNPDGRSERSVLFDSATDRRHVCKPSADDFEVIP